jgi:hypothetical protein
MPQKNARDETSFLVFLVPRRSEIQALCLELLLMIRESPGKERAKRGSAEWELLTLLAGASFSLWRAVFTVYVGIADENTAECQTDSFLAGLIATNAIGFGQEQNQWSYGYYSVNARFRLTEAYRCLPKPLKRKYRPLIEPIAKTHQWDEPKTRFEQYDEVHKAFLQLVALLKDHLNVDKFKAWPPTGRKERSWIDGE